MLSTKISNILVFLFFHLIIAEEVPLCSLKCTSNQILDLAKCLCVPKLDCSIQPIDSDGNCIDSKCDSQSTCDSCPKKCYCEEPSILNKYCPACLNGGVRNYTDLNECTCTCYKGFQGSRCQYIPTPCELVDEPFCSTVNCYNASEDDFFRCQRKCLCCKNKRCYNFGTLNSRCECECMKSKSGEVLFDAATDCKNYIASGCEDDSKCYSQFKVYRSNKMNCAFDFVKAVCPRMCGLCS